MTPFVPSEDSGVQPADFDLDLDRIFIGRDQQLFFFTTYLDRWKLNMTTASGTGLTTAPSPNNKLQGLLVLLYGRGGFGKSTLLTHFRNITREPTQKLTVSETLDWEFTIEGKRSLFNPPPGREVDAPEYFKFLCSQLSAALKKRPDDFKEYQAAIKAVEDAQKQARGVLDSLQKDDRFASLRMLAGPGAITLLRWIEPRVGQALDSAKVTEKVEEVIGQGAQIGAEKLVHAYSKLHDKLGHKLNDYLDPALRLGLALGRDLSYFARNFPILIFFDTYEEVDEADPLLRLVIGAAGARVGWVLAGRDNLWAGYEQRKRSVGKVYGYKEIVPPGLGLAIDFNAGGIGAFTTSDILEYFSLLHQQVPAQLALPIVTEEDAEHILDVTQGVPLAVRIAAGLYRGETDLAIITEKTDGKREIVDEMVQRYLLHTHDDQPERMRLYGLAMLRRSDHPTAIAAALELSPEQARIRYETELSHLQRRYSFIFTEKAQPSLHQEVRHFLRLWLLERRNQPEIMAVNKRLKQAHETALQELEDHRQYGTLRERLEDEEWVGVYLDLAEQQFWLDPGEGVHFCLPFFIAAAIYQHAITQDAARIGAFFAAQIKQPFRTWWEWAVHGLISAQDKNQLGKGLTELIELVNLASQRSLAFPPPLPGLRTELEGALWWMLAEARLQKDDRDALAWYEKALTRLSQEEELKAAAAKAYVRVGSLLFLRENKNEEALPFLDRAIELSPHDVDAYLYRGNVYENMKQYEQAFADHTQSLILDPNSARAYVYRGNTYRRLQQYEQALADYAQALTLGPGDHGFDHAWAYIHRGHAYQTMKQYEQAIADYTQTISIDPDSAWSNINTWAYLYRGHAYRNMKQYEQAIADYTQTITLAPNEPEAYLHRGYAHLNLKKREQACVDFAKYAALEPRDVNAAWMVVYASLNKQRPGSEFAERLEEIAAIDPQQYVAHVCKGVALGLRGKLKEGLAELEQAISLKPEDWDAYFWKGMLHAYFYRGRNPVAVEYVEKALEVGLPPVLLTPLYWLEKDLPDFYEKHAAPLLAGYEV